MKKVIINIDVVEEEENIRKFLTGNRRKLISIKELEKQAHIPQSTLSKFLTGYFATLPKKHLKNLISVLFLIGYKQRNQLKEK